MQADACNSIDRRDQVPTSAIAVALHLEGEETVVLRRRDVPKPRVTLSPADGDLARRDPVVADAVRNVAQGLGDELRWTQDQVCLMKRSWSSTEPRHEVLTDEVGHVRRCRDDATLVRGRLSSAEVTR